MIAGVPIEVWVGMFLLFAVNGQIHIWSYKRRQKEKRRKFLRAVAVEYPNARLTFIAVEDSDEVAMARLERLIRENRYEGPHS